MGHFERFDIDWHSIDDGFRITMDKNSRGEWVRFDEAEEAIDECEERIKSLEAEIEELKGAKE